MCLGVWLGKLVSIDSLWLEKMTVGFIFNKRILTWKWVFVHFEMCVTLHMKIILRMLKWCKLSLLRALKCLYFFLISWILESSMRYDWLKIRFFFYISLRKKWKFKLNTFLLFGWKLWSCFIPDNISLLVWKQEVHAIHSI